LRGLGGNTPGPLLPTPLGETLPIAYLLFISRCESEPLDFLICIFIYTCIYTILANGKQQIRFSRMQNPYSRIRNLVECKTAEYKLKQLNTNCRIEYQILWWKNCICLKLNVNMAYRIYFGGNHPSHLQVRSAKMRFYCHYLLQIIVIRHVLIINQLDWIYLELKRYNNWYQAVAELHADSTYWWFPTLSLLVQNTW
jgi:hypothetical protein